MLVIGFRCEMFARSDGTRAMRLSVSVSVAPEKMLLKPRTTT